MDIPKLKSNLHVRLTILLIGIYILAIIQDYIYAQLKATGFFLSESALYNLFWVFFVPFLMLYARKLWLWHKFKPIFKISIGLIIAILLSIIHIVVFTLFFIVMSRFLFEQPHRFQAMIKTVFSNQFYLSVIIYTVFPFLVKRNDASLEKKKDGPQYLIIKDGKSIERVLMDSIIYIKTDRPYIKIVTIGKKYLYNATLDAMMKNLEMNSFIRVHRSVIINIKQVVSLKSRKNGDFDAQMSNGDEVRFSRHYREAWAVLLHKA